MGHRVLLTIAGLGILARLALAAVSIGSYDAVLWQGFAEQIQQHGLLEMYRSEPSFNHPPIPGLWASFALNLAGATGLRFAFVFKLPMIAADALVCVLIWRILLRRAGATYAAFATAAFAWNLGAILISAYHCNTDSVYAMLALLAVYLVEDKSAHLLAGMALGTAINVKLIPAILIIPMIGTCRDRRTLIRFIGGLAIGAIPFVPVLLGRGREFVQHAIAYTPPPTYWGVNYFLLNLVRDPNFSGWAQPLMNHYQELSRYVIVLAVVLLTLVARRRGRFDRYTLCAASAALTLVLAPGFAMQYTVFPLPLLGVVFPWTAMAYGAIAGTGMAINYRLASSGGWPMSSTLGGPIDPALVSMFGLFAWAQLLIVVCMVWLPTLRRHAARLFPLSGRAARP